MLKISPDSGRTGYRAGGSRFLATGRCFAAHGAGSSRKRAIALLACAGFASSASIRVCDPVIPQLAAVFDTSAGEASAVISVFSVAYGLFLALVRSAWRPLQQVPAGHDRDFGMHRRQSLPPPSRRALTGWWRHGSSPGPPRRRSFRCRWHGSGTMWSMGSGRRCSRASCPARSSAWSAGSSWVALMADTLGWRWSFHVLAGTLYSGGPARCSLELLYGGAAGVAAGGVGRSGGGMPLATAMRSVVRVPWARAILLIGFVEGAAVFGPLAFIPTYLHLRFDLSLTGSAAILGTYGLGGLLYSLTAKRLVGLFGERGLAAGGGALLCARLFNASDRTRLAVRAGRLPDRRLSASTCCTTRSRSIRPKWCREREGRRWRCSSPPFSSASRPAWRWRPGRSMPSGLSGCSVRPPWRFR